MFNKSEIDRRKRLRGNVLQNAYIIAVGYSHNPDDPYKVARTTLEQALEGADQLPSSTDLKETLHYLDDLGAIQVSWKTDGSGSYYSFKLCHKGIDLVEGSEAHSGIAFSRRR